MTEPVEENQEELRNGEVVSRKVALQEFERFCDAMDIDDNVTYMGEDEQASFAKFKQVILRRMQGGSLIINHDGEAEYKPIKTTINKDKPDQRLVFHERTGAHMLTMDGKKKNHDMSKMYGVLAGMCKVHPSIFAKMIGPDLKTCEALFVLLMV